MLARRGRKTSDRPWGSLGLPQSTATGIVGASGGLVYLSTVLGGWIADRLLGMERTGFRRVHHFSSSRSSVGSTLPPESTITDGPLPRDDVNVIKRRDEDAAGSRQHLVGDLLALAGATQHHLRAVPAGGVHLHGRGFLGHDDHGRDPETCGCVSDGPCVVSARLRPWPASQSR